MSKNIFFPALITVIIIIIIIYLFINIEQPYYTCTKNTNTKNVLVSDTIKIGLQNNKIKEINLNKIITVKEDYLSKNDGYPNAILFTAETAYEYLDKDIYIINKNNNSVDINIEATDDEVLIINNLEFNDNNAEIEINTNTKSNDVVVLKVGDTYIESDLVKYLKNNGYTCK